MDTIHESGIVTHFRWHRAEQVANPLLVFNINIKIAHKYDTAIGTNTFLATAELARFHVPLHYVDAILLVKGNAGNFIETDTAGFWA